MEQHSVVATDSGWLDVGVRIPVRTVCCCVEKQNSLARVSPKKRIHQLFFNKVSPMCKSAKINLYFPTVVYSSSIFYPRNVIPGGHVMKCNVLCSLPCVQNSFFILFTTNKIYFRYTKKERKQGILFSTTCPC